jgi:hypothetical protein
MTTTIRVPEDRLASYFDTFTKRFLRDDSPEAVDVEVISPELGDQKAVTGARLIGITYDRKSGSLEIEIEPGDLRVYHPREVWTIEESDGFVSGLEVVRDDGARELVSVRRARPRRAD